MENGNENFLRRKTKYIEYKSQLGLFSRTVEGSLRILYSENCNWNKKYKRKLELSLLWNLILELSIQSRVTNFINEWLQFQYTRNKKRNNYLCELIGTILIQLHAVYLFKKSKKRLFITLLIFCRECWYIIQLRMNNKWWWQRWDANPQNLIFESVSYVTYKLLICYYKLIRPNFYESWVILNF